MADTLIFLKLDDIEGESTAAGFEKQIEVESAAWDLATQSSQTLASGGEASKAQLDYGLVTLNKHFDRSSLSLLKRSALTEVSGKPTPRETYKSAVLTMADVVIQSDGEQAKITPVIRIELGNGYIEGYELQAEEATRSVRVSERVKLSFRTIKFTYFRSSDSGSTRSVGLNFEGETPFKESGQA